MHVLYRYYADHMVYHLQSDMAEIVHQNLYQRLEQDSPVRKEKLSKSPKRKMITSNKDDAEKIFKHEFIKHSWLF